jgi:hypothetical protein
LGSYLEGGIVLLRPALAKPHTLNHQSSRPFLN